MPRHRKPRALFAFALLTALLICGARQAEAADACSPGALKVARSFDVGANFGLTTVSIAAADFNGDGRPDFAATDVEGNSVAVLLNDGTGWFAAPRRFAAGTQPSAVAVADLNSDGQFDLVVANQGGGNVSVLLGSGGGNFGPASNFAAGQDPFAVAVGDFNGDSKPDLVVGILTSSVIGGRVAVLLGDGSGSFSQAAGSPFDVDGDPNSFAVADFNSDSKRDIIIGTFSGYYLALGDGTGRFSAPALVESRGGSAVATADVNGDGKSDLVMGGTALVVRTGDGAGNFSAPTIINREGNVSVDRLALGDVDGDGIQDVAAASNSPAGVTYFKGDGAGGYSPTKSYLGDNNPNSLAVGDFDGDGKLDIATGGNAFNTRPTTDISVFRNNGGGDFEAARAAYTTLVQPSGFTSFSSPLDIAHGDFNGDGREDLAVLNRQGFDLQSARVTILLRDASGNFTPSASIVYFNGSSLFQIIAADFNKDGKTDVAVAATISVPFSHVVSVSLSNGDGTFAAPKNISISPAASSPSSLAAGDFNNDGNLDMVVVGGQSQNVITLVGDGAGNFSFAPGGIMPLGTGFDAVAVGDFNNDSKLDAVVTDSARQRVLVLLGNGFGVFFAPIPVGVGGAPSAAAVADFNKDGKADIAVANHAAGGGFGTLDEGNVSVLLGDGTGAFAAAASYRVGVQPDDVVAGDFDNDGKLDLAVANEQSSTISLLSGDGAGAFAPSTTFGVTGAPGALAAYDFDGDGRTDVAAALPNARAAGVLYAAQGAALPCLFADDATVTEGDSGTTDALVNVRLSGPSAQEVKVNYLVRSNPPSTEALDIVHTAGTLTFLPGETAKSVPVPVLGDAINEDPDTFTLSLSGAANARISDGVAKLSVLDNDPQPTISISDAAPVTETDSQKGTATFNVTLSAPSSKTVGVDYATAGGTATAGSDFDGVQGTLFFPAGVTSKTITVDVRIDQTHESDETFFVNLSNPSNATIADAQGAGTIIDNDPVPSVTISDLTSFEVNGADNTASFGLRLSNPSASPISFDYATADGTATAGSDYVAASGTVTFNPGETFKTVNVTVKDDAVDEVNETFFVNLSNPVNATIADGQSLCTIFDNDGPTISINDVSVTEGQGGTTKAVFTVTLSAPSVQDVSMRAATAPGTATQFPFPPDFQGVSFGFVLVPAGSTSVTFTVLVNGDLVIEPDETFFVNLSQPQNGTIADGQGVGMILNDDVTSAQFASAAGQTVGEKDGRVQLTVNRVGDLSGSFSVNYTTFEGTASERSDFTAALGTLRFAPGESSKTITVFVTDDALVEGDEDFGVALFGPNGSPVNAPSNVRVVITSDDATNGPNPIDSSAFFVTQHYRDFLGRDPDAAGLAFWVNEIEKCGADAQCREVRRINVSAAFFLSIEFQETGYLVERTYKAAFGDATSPGVAGTVPVVRLEDFLLDTRNISEGVVVNVGDWQTQLENNKRAFAFDFVGRPAFLSAYPSTMTAQEFVDKLDLRAGGVLSADEKAQLVSDLSAGAADASRRAGVLRQVAENATLRQREKNRAFVLMEYFGYLRRNPSDAPELTLNYAGWRFWLDKLEENGGNFVKAEMVKAFITSDEYRNRFGQ